MATNSETTFPHVSPAIMSQVPAPERRRDTQDFSGTVFRGLEELGLRYSLLHAPDPETSSSPSGIELTIHPEDRDRLPSLIQNIRKEGYVPIQRAPLAAKDCRYDFASSMDADTRFFSMTVREIFPSGHLMARDGDVFARRQKHGDFWVLCEADEFYYLLSKISLEGEIKEREQNRVKELAKILGPSVVGTVAAELFGDALQQGVMAACIEGQWDKIKQRLRNQLRRANFRSAPIDWFKYRLLQFRCALQRRLQPCGISIVILGPDGAGKSTLTRKIHELFEPLFSGYRAFLWRPQVLMPSPKIEVPWFDPPHTRPPYSHLTSVIKLFAVAADYWLAYPTLFWPLLAHRKLITFDRDFHDILVDRVRYRYDVPVWLAKVAVALTPMPETVYLILDADADIILNRKNEVAPNELHRQRKAYVELVGKLPNSTLIRTDLGFEASTSAAMGAVLKYMVRRFEYRQREVVPPPPRQPDSHQTTSQPLLSTAGAGRKSYKVMRSLGEFFANWRVWFFKGSMAVTDQGLISGSNFILSIILARYLSASHYGTYAVAFSTFVLFSLVHQALVLEPMSVLGPSMYRDSMRHYLGILTWIQLGFSAVIVVCLASVGIAGSVLEDPSRLMLAFIGMGVASPFVLLFWFARRAYYLHLLPGRAVIGAVAYSALLCAGIGGLYHARALSPFTAFLVMGVSALLTSILLLIRLRSVAESSVAAARLTLRHIAVQHWRYGRWALVSMVFFWIPWNIFYSVVTRYSGLEGTGTLKALLNLALPITATYAAFSMLFLPYTARLGAEGGWKAAKVQAWRIAGLFVLGSGVYWLAVCLFRNQLVQVLYKGQYAEVIPLVPVIAISSILAGAAMGPTIAIRAMQSPATVARVYFGSALVSIVVGIPACKVWGYRGAVLAILLSSLTTCIVGFLKCSDPKGIKATHQRSAQSKMPPGFASAAEADAQQEVR